MYIYFQTKFHLFMYIFLNICTTEIFIQFFFLFLLYFKMPPLGSTWIWSEMKICTYRIYICTVVYGWLLATNCDVVSKISTSIRQEICLQAYREREGVGVLLIRLGGLMGGGYVHYQFSYSTIHIQCISMCTKRNLSQLSQVIFAIYRNRKCTKLKHTCQEI